MSRWMYCAAAWVVTGIIACRAQTGEGPEGLLQRITERARENLERLPDYACQQTVERYTRFGNARPFQKMDTLRLEVGLVGDKELYSWPGMQEFQEQQLAEMVGKGTVGTGHFGLLAKHVFLARAADFTYLGEEPLEGGPAIRFDYDVPRRRSGYRLRQSTSEAVVAFQGTFWVEAETLDLMRLEVHAYDIPEELGLAEAANVMEYARMRIGNSEFLMPKSSELTLVAVDGNESQNRMQLTGCRQYVGEATLSFHGTESGEKAHEIEGGTALPARSLLELALETDIDPESTTVGDEVRALLARPLRAGERELLPQGAVALGRIVRLEKRTLPFPHYEVGLQFHMLETGDQRIGFVATMEDAGPSSGLVRQARSMNPTFDRRRSPRMDILVRETPRGQGVLHWEAKKSRIPRGLKMKWRVEAAR